MLISVLSVCFFNIGSISEADFSDITEALGKDELQAFFHTLGLPHRDIEKAECDAGTLNVNLRARSVLLFWRQTNGDLATRHAVLQALQKNRNWHAIKQLEAKWNLEGELFLPSSFNIFILCFNCFL